MQVYGDIICGTVDRLEFDPAEVCRRLQIPRGYDFEAAERCARLLEPAMSCRYAYIRTPVDYPSEGVCRFDFAEIKSEDLFKNLRGCREVFVFAVTLGIGVDRLLCRLNLTSRTEHFIVDALSSAAVESLCDITDKKIRSTACTSDVKFRPRFSPGYGDVDIWVQRPLLNRLQADKTLGITLNSAYLMTPMKSITAIMGREACSSSMTTAGRLGTASAEQGRHSTKGESSDV